MKKKEKKKVFLFGLEVEISVSGFYFIHILLVNLLLFIVFAKRLLLLFTNAWFRSLATVLSARQLSLTHHVEQVYKNRRSTLLFIAIF